jgi:hypothetical protein
MHDLTMFRVLYGDPARRPYCWTGSVGCKEWQGFLRQDLGFDLEVRLFVHPLLKIAEAVPICLFATTAILANEVQSDVSFGDERTDRSIGSRSGRHIDIS